MELNLKLFYKDIRRIVNCQSNVGNPLCDIFPDIFKHFVIAFVNAVFLSASIRCRASTYLS